jgi:hypothetical protein
MIKSNLNWRAAFLIFIKLPKWQNQIILTEAILKRSIISMAKIENDSEALQRRLDLIIHLLLMGLNPAKVPSVTEQIVLLSSHNLSPAEIGRIIGRESNYVSAMLKSRTRSKSR